MLRYEKIKKFDDFLADFGRAAKPTMNMSIYQSDYACGCGETHWFPGYRDIICEGLMKFMMPCPNVTTIVNEIKVKTFLAIKFKGLETLASTEIETEDDLIAMSALKSFFRNR